MNGQEVKLGAIYLAGLQNDAAFKQHFLTPLLSYKEGIERTLRDTSVSHDDIRVAQGALQALSYMESLIHLRGEYKLNSLMRKQSGSR